MVGQAVELALKAFLLSKGVSLRKLRMDYGHKLHRSLRKSKELGLEQVVQLSDEEHSVLALLDDVYSTKQLQYIVTGPKTYPIFGPLARAALKLIHGIGKEVGYPPQALPNVL